MKRSVEVKPDGLTFQWVDYPIRIEIARIQNHKDGRIVGYIKVQDTARAKPHLREGSFNFTTLLTREKWVNTLSKICPTTDNHEYPWAEAFEEMAHEVVERTLLGEPIREVWTRDDIEEPPYLVYPIARKGQAVVIFGEGGIGKSYLAMLIGTVAQLPWKDNPLGLKPEAQVNNVLYLDWEADEETFAWRLTKLQRGLGLPHYSFHYRPCNFPLSHDVGQIIEKAWEIKAGLVIIDSIGAACGSDLNAAEAANVFNNALRQLNATSLAIGHTAKGDSLRPTIYGSTFFTNRPRSVWELQKSQEIGQDEMVLALWHRKSNDSRLFMPLGYALKFTDYDVNIKCHDIRTMDDFLAGMPIHTRINFILKHGPLTMKEILDKLNVSEDAKQTSEGTLKTELNRMLNAEKVAKMGGQLWGLAFQGELEE